MYVEPGPPNEGACFKISAYLMTGVHLTSQLHVKELPTHPCTSAPARTCRGGGGDGGRHTKARATPKQKNPRRSVFFRFRLLFMSIVFCVAF